MTPDIKYLGLDYWVCG